MIIITFYLNDGFEGVFLPTIENSGMNYQQRNRALFECIRGRCERIVDNRQATYRHDVDFEYYPLFYIRYLFFPYAPLCMSLHDAVADDSFREPI